MATRLRLRVHDDIGYFQIGEVRHFRLSTAIASDGTTEAPEWSDAGDFAITSHATGGNAEFKNVGGFWVQFGDNKKEWVGVLTQAGTAAPTAAVQRNGVGTIVWTRSGVGVYVGTLEGAFPLGKVAAFAQIGAATGTDVEVVHTSADVITVNTFDVSNAAADIVGTIHLKIEVYP